MLALLALPCTLPSGDSSTTFSDAKRADMHARWMAAKSDDAGHRPRAYEPAVPPTTPSDGGHEWVAPPAKPVDGGHEWVAPPARPVDSGHGALVPPTIQAPITTPTTHLPSQPPAPPNLPPPHRTHSEIMQANEQVVVISLGGIGVATLLKELSLLPAYDAQLLADIELRHLPFRRLVAEHGEAMSHVNRILYIWGEPTRTLKSIYHKGYETFMATHSRQDGLPATHDIQAGTFDANAAFWDVPHNLAAYADAPTDVFEMQLHLESYLDAPSDGSFHPKIAFLQIEKKTANLGKLAQFLNLSELDLQAKLSPWEVAYRGEQTPRLTLEPN